MIKVMFTSHHFTDEQTFLDSILKMTPGKKGIWKDMVAVTNPKEADYYAIFDGSKHQYPDMKEKAIYFGQHPYTPYSPVEKLFPGKQALLKFPLKHYLNPGEWWIPHTYDELMALEPPKKTKKLFVCHTYQTHHEMYYQRPKFTKAFIEEYPDFDFDLYGRPPDPFRNDPILSKRYKGVLGIENYDALKGEHIVGKENMIDYEYSIEYDVGLCKNYFSERLYDAILLWVFPFYFGCNNLSSYLPMCFEYFDQYDTEQEPHKIMNSILNDTRSIFMEDIKEARDLLLNKYQTFPYVYDVVTNIDKYRAEQTKLGLI